MEPTLTTLVMGMIGFSSEGSESISRKKIYTTLFELAQKREFKESFRDCHFSKIPDGVYSKQIEEILFRLGTGRIALQGGYGFHLIEVSSKAKIAVRDYLEKEYPEHIDYMKNMAREFNKILYS